MVTKADSAASTILIISSYNPEAQNVSDNISEFVVEFDRLGGDVSVLVESMNCKNLSEAFAWPSRMEEILSKYTGYDEPGLILLLGQEAWATYLSLDSDYVKRIPIMCGMASRNVITIPLEPLDLTTWEPVSKDARTDFMDFNIVGGLLYEYDINKNIDLVRHFFPDTRRITFLTDNTYGGINLQTLTKKQVKEDVGLEFEWLDGRLHSVLDVNEEIANMDVNSNAVIVGTWRIDSSEKYVVGKTSYMLYDLNPNLPVFTASSVGLGTWVVGGYAPQYRMQGTDLAKIAYAFLYGTPSKKRGLEIIPSRYVFDAVRLNDFGFTQNRLPANSILINESPNILNQYKYQILGLIVIFFVLLFSFLTALYYVLRINKLKDNLEKSSIDFRNAKEEAEEANRLKTAFLANMSHEIRTPLNAIVGFSSVITSKDISDEERDQYCEIIQKNSDLLLNLINDILDISRLESGRVKLLQEKCTVNDLCQTAVTTVKQTRRTNAHFHMELPQEPIEITTDSQRLQQVFINLLTNAAKFTSEGLITVAVTVNKPKEEIIVRVTDTGCGIPIDKAEAIFERFEKLDEYAQGTGLGLPICKVIVENLGGKIWLDTEYTGGACFVFTHPL